jgi:dienelactone hydrolase
VITRRNFLETTIALALTLAIPTTTSQAQTSNFQPQQPTPQESKYKATEEDVKKFWEDYEKYKNKTPPTIENNDDKPYQTLTFQGFELWTYKTQGPTVLISPAKGIPSDLEKRLAKNLAKNKYQPIIMNIPSSKNMIESLVSSITSPNDAIYLGEMFNMYWDQTLRDYFQAIDYTKENISEQTAILGASMGGIIALSLMGLEQEKSETPRINAGISLMGGGNFPKIIATSTLDEIKNLRDPILKKIDRNKAWLEEQLQGQIKFDPENLAHRINGKKLFFTIAGNDTCIPTGKDIKQLIPTLSKKNTWSINGLGHIPAYGSVLTQPKRIINFLDETLN